MTKRSAKSSALDPQSKRQKSSTCSVCEGNPELTHCCHTQAGLRYLQTVSGELSTCRFPPLSKKAARERSRPGSYDWQPRMCRFCPLALTQLQTQTQNLGSQSAAVHIRPTDCRWADSDFFCSFMVPCVPWLSLHPITHRGSILICFKTILRLRLPWDIRSFRTILVGDTP